MDDAVPVGVADEASSFERVVRAVESLFLAALMAKRDERPEEAAKLTQSVPDWDEIDGEVRVLPLPPRPHLRILV